MTTNIDRELAESLDSFLRFVSRLMRYLYRQYITQFENQEITQRQYRVLCILESGPYKMTELGEAVHTSYGSLTVMIDRLVDKGMVERCFLPEDRRVVMVKITPKGDETLKKYRNTFLDLCEKHIVKLSENEKQTLKRAITEIKTIAESNFKL